MSGGAWPPAQQLVDEAAPTRSALSDSTPLLQPQQAGASKELALSGPGLTLLVGYALVATLALLLMLVGEQAPLAAAPAAPARTSTLVDSYAGVAGSVPLPSYTALPYVPPIHRSGAARFVHLTDIHLEYAYEANSVTPASTKLQVCRRAGQPAEDGSSEQLAATRHFDWSVGGGDAKAASQSKLDTSSRFPLGRINCDSPLSLLDSTLATLASPAFATSQSPYDFVVLSGDLVAHDVGSAAIANEVMRKVLSATVAQLGAVVRSSGAREGPRIFPAIGNADLFPASFIDATAEPVHFALTQGGAPIACNPTFANLLALYTAQGLLRTAEAQKTFCQGGFYSAQLDDLNLRVIVLNSVPYSPDYTFDSSVGADAAQQAQADTDSGADRATAPKEYPPASCDDPAREADPFGQQAWLDSMFAAAAQAQQQVLLVTHILPGHKDAPGQFGWCARYVAPFQALLARYPQLVVTSLFGDFSEDETRFLYPPPPPRTSEVRLAKQEAPTPTLTMFVAPGLSPRKHTNPSFRVFYADAARGQRAQLLDYAQWYLPLQYANNAVAAGQPFSWQWQYNFVHTFGVTDLSPASLAGLAHTLSMRPQLMFQYQLQLSANNPTTVSPNDLLCDMNHVDPDLNQQCKQTGDLRV